MVSEYPQKITTVRPIGPSVARDEHGVWAQAMIHLQHWWCGLHGHDSLLQFEQDRMFLRCTSCGYETPGWSVGASRRARRFGEQPRRSALAPRPQIVGARRIA